MYQIAKYTEFVPTRLQLYTAILCFKCVCSV